MTKIISIVKDGVRRDLTVEAFDAIIKGGQGSGNFGHAGRPGEIGGSGEGSAGPDEPDVDFQWGHEPMGENDFSSSLQNIVNEPSEDYSFVGRVETFDDRGIMTNNVGLIVGTDAGDEFQLTVDGSYKGNKDDENFLDDLDSIIQGGEAPPNVSVSTFRDEGVLTHNEGLVFYYKQLQEDKQGASFHENKKFYVTIVQSKSAEERD